MAGMEEDLLDERISSLTKELEESGREIVSLALATYDAHELAKVFDASTAKPLKFDLKHPPQQMVPLFVEEVNELLRKSQEQQKFLSEHKHKIDYCQHLSATLQHISGIIDKLVQAEDAILNADLLLAAKLLGEMQSLLQNKPTPKDIDLNNPLMKSTLLSSTTPVYKALSKEYKLHKARLVNKCKRLLQDCITVEIGRVNVCTILTGYIRSEDKVIDKAIQLTHIYDVLVQLEADRSVIDHYLHLFFRHIVKLFYKEKKAYLPNTTITPYTVTVNGTATQGIQSEFMLGSMVKGGYNVAELQEQVDENCSAYYALGTSKLPLSDVFNHLAQFVVFLSAQVFLGHESVCRTAGEVFTQAPFNLVSQMQQLIVSQLPKHATDIPAYSQNIRPVVSQLQEKLQKCLSIQTTELVDSLGRLHLTYVQTKRAEILAFARHLLCLDYHNLMIAASGDALEDDLSSASLVQESKARFPDLDIWGSRSRDLGLEQSLCMQKLKFETCQISMNVCRVLKYMHEVMNQVVANFTDHLTANVHMENPLIVNDIVSILFHTARDILELFFAVIPTKYHKVIHENIRMGAVFYNDCHYIAHNCILMTFKYKNQLVKAVKSVPNKDKYDEDDLYCIGFVDFIPRLRQFGEDCLNHHIRKILNKCTDMIVQMKVKPDHQPNKKSSATTTYNSEQEMHHIIQEVSHFVNALEDILPCPMFNRVVNIVLDDLCTQLMSPVLVAECVTITGANEIQRLFKMFADYMNGLLHIPSVAFIPTSTSSHLPPTPLAAHLLLTSSTSSFTPTSIYIKFVVLTDLLDYSLTDIAEALSSQRCVMFTSKEMTRLVLALFEDSPKRQALLDSIQMVSVQEATGER